eukprot:UN08620
MKTQVFCCSTKNFASSLWKGNPHLYKHVISPKGYMKRHTFMLLLRKNFSSTTKNASRQL